MDDPHVSLQTAADAWPAGDGEMARRVREHDWAATPVGPAEAWRGEFRAIVDLVLASPLVSSVVCGPERILIYNAAAARLYGDKHPGALGKPLAESFPDAYPVVAPFYDRAFAGESVHAPTQALSVSPAGGEVFDAYLTPVRGEDGQVMCVHMIGLEIGARLRAEAALRESEERQAFLLKLSDALRALADPVEIQRAATRLLGDQLKASRVFYVVVENDGDTAAILGDYTNGVPSRVGRYSLSAFSSYAAREWRAGRTASTSDVEADPRWSESERAAYASVSTRAGFGVPLIKEGRLVALLGVNQSTPRHWTDWEIDLAREVAERTWAAVERARAESALRASERRLRALFESIDEGFSEMQVILDEKGHVVDWLHLVLNGNFSRVTGIPDITGRLASEVFPSLEGEWFRRMDLAYRTGEPQRFETELAELGRWFDNYITRLGGEDGDRVLGVFGDITERKLAERKLRESEERQAFLLQLSDALRPLAKPGEIERRATHLLGEHLQADRCFLTLVDEDGERLYVREGYLRSGASSVLGDYTFAQFGDFVGRALHAGRILAVEDVAALTDLTPAERASYAAVEIAAYLLVPLVRNGRLAAYLTINHRTPRAWSDADKSIARQAADRAWAAVERARAEAELRESEERRAFLLRLSDEMRPLTDAVEVQERAVVALGAMLSVDRCYYVEVDRDRGLAFVNHEYRSDRSASLVGQHSLASFEHMYALLASGEPVICPDVGSHPGLAGHAQAYREHGVQAIAVAPLIKGGRIEAVMTLTMERPRSWTDTEVQLLTEVAERTWAAVERARAEAALRENEARLAAAFESVPVGIAVNDRDGRPVLENVIYRRFVPSGVIPSRDPERVARWRAWDARGRPIPPQDFPSARAEGRARRAGAGDALHR